MARPGRQSNGGEAIGLREGREAGPGRAADGPGEVLFRPLLSNLQVPRPRVDVVPRRGLVAALLRSSAPLVVVSAPAGSGKTLALVQWVQAAQCPSAWLQLDRAANDPVVLLTYLGLALESFSEVDPALFAWLQESVTPIKSRILPSLEATLADAGPFLLVLDDAHLVRSKACWEILSFVIDHLPSGAQLVLSTREDPPLPLGKMRASGLVAEIRAPELALSRDEAGQLLRLHGRPVEDDTLQAMLTATEGWAAGLYLALLAGEGRSTGEWLPQIRGDQREIADYLSGEVLERQPYRTQEFLLRTSILERFSAPLCRVVTGRSDAHLALGHLAKENLFVTALDEREEWYRYHHLFAELLRAQLARKAPDELPGLHRAAAAWHSERGDPEQAIRHWLAAGDFRPAADLFAAVESELLDRGQLATGRRLLELFSDAQILSHKPLTLAAGWVFGFGNPHWVADVRVHPRLVRAACSMEVDDSPSLDGTASLRESQAQLRAFLAPDGIGRMVADAELAASLRSDANDDWYVMGRKLLGTARYLAGQGERAIALLEVATTCGDPWVESESLAYRALVAAERGRWDEAAELAELAMTRVPAGHEYGPPLATQLASARVASRRGDSATGVLVAGTTRFLEEMPGFLDWEVLLASVLLGEVCLEQDDLNEAKRWSDRARGILRRYPDAGMLGPRAERLRLALQERILGQAVTPAEQRVLDLLPTQLSVNDIGARLFISRNTMKSHMRSLYAKLDVHSRTEAVERARELGLLKSDR